MSNPTVNSVFEAFIEADKAMKELPAIREELASTKEALDSSNDEVIDLLDKLHASQVALENLKASLSVREAELAHATFRADAVEAKHRALRSILSSGDDSVVAVDGALSGDQSEQNPTVMTAQNATSHNVDAAGDANSQTHSDLDHPQSPGPTGSLSSGSESESRGQSENNPTPNEATMADQSISTAQGNGDIVGQSDVDPTAPTNGTSPAPQPESPTSAPGPAENAPSQTIETTSNLAFSGQPSTRKPDGMEWGYWIVNGGEAPLWYSPTDIERVKARYAEYAGHAKAAAE